MSDCCACLRAFDAAIISACFCNENGPTLSQVRHESSAKTLRQRVRRQPLQPTDRAMGVRVSTSKLHRRRQRIGSEYAEHDIELRDRRELEDVSVKLNVIHGIAATGSGLRVGGALWRWLARRTARLRTKVILIDRSMHIKRHRTLLKRRGIFDPASFHRRTSRTTTSASANLRALRVLRGSPAVAAFQRLTQYRAHLLPKTLETEAYRRIKGLSLRWVRGRTRRRRGPCRSLQ